ncbi:MAG: hypothetical protein KIT16_08230 [Rhodospirillaceae bacterium]|nr:hypothetical protein [Rhodospirillaceae bacterium]
MHRGAVPLACLAVFAASVPAEAKIACFPLERVEAALNGATGEGPRFVGEEAEGVEYRLYVNRQTGSWSWIGIPSGTRVACLLFSGKAKPGEAPAPHRSPRRPPPSEAQF